MGHETPAFPEFNQIPSPDVVERDVMGPYASSVTSYEGELTCVV
jgi:hypothetical protein